MSAEQPFVHLHVHTEFSLLDGLSKIDKLVARAKELEMESLAITDHGAMFGVVQFYRACQKAGIKPIIGMEGYLAKQNRHVHDQSERQPYHLLLLAKDQVGYKNLLQIASSAQLEGFYSKPRTDKEFLKEHAQGIICTTGCLAAEIPRMIVDGREDEAKKTIGMYQDIFGKENFFLELQDHDISEIKVLNNWLIENRDYADVPLVATNDVHYVLNEDFNAHDTLLCIQTGALKSETKRMKMTDPSYHLRTPQEMWSIFGHIRDGEALRNTMLVAEMCNVNLESKGYHLPIFPVPDGYNADTYLRYLAERGLRWRYGAHADKPEVKARLNYELSVIHQMGFDTYFLIVWDLCQYAHSADIWWNVRGSGAGSVVAYSLGITNIDPIANNLIFERFLNPGRVSMPDIDMDFPDDRRMEMIHYAMQKYGSDKVAAIITFGTMKARAAIKDVGRVLDYPLADVTILTKLIPQIPSRPVTLADCLGDNPEKAVPELKKLYDEDEDIKTLLDTAVTVEGVARNAGTHAAGIIIGDKPLVEYLPLHRPIGDTPVTQVTQFAMEICESIGLLKVDFLGLSTLTIMRKACELIEKYHGIRYTMANIPYQPKPDTPDENEKLEKAFELIGQGETTGIFQLEGSGMTRMLIEMKPTTFEHIIAAISLYRPGPMELIPSYIKRMHGKEEVTYHHPLLEPILKETYGIIVYQESIQQLAANLFGYSLGDADLMRRAVSKKKAKDLLTHKQTFMEKGPENGISPEIAEKIFDEIEYFAAYGFNKCVVGSTEIVDPTTGCLHRIADLASGKAHIDYVLTCDTATLRLGPGKVTAIHENGVKPVYRLTTRLGRHIEATANHPFYTRNGWKTLKQLAVGDKIAVPRRAFAEGNKTWPEQQVIELGHSLGNGSRKTIPDDIFDLTNSQVKLLLSAISEKGRRWSHNTERLPAKHYVIRQQLATQLQTLYSRQGTATRIHSIPAKFRALPHQIPVALEILTQDDPDIEGDIFWDTIVSIRSAGDQPTFDLTVEGTHNFVANDIIVHNSHAADYAVLTCQTAYLKAHYPEEYYTALLSVQRDVIEDVRVFISDCRRLGISVLPPNINSSDVDFTIEQTGQDNHRGIRYGLGAVKNAGEKAVQQIVDVRHKGGPFEDISDFCRRCDLRQVGKRALESLIKVGAFDDLGKRDSLLISLDRLIKFSADHHRASDVGQMSLFGGDDGAASDALALSSPPAGKETPQRELLRWEKELIGLYVSEHPLNAVMGQIRHLPNIHYSETLRRESEQTNGRGVTVAGLIVAMRHITTKKGDTMAVVTLEDIQGNIDCVLFPRTYNQYQSMIVVDKLIIVRGKADSSRGDMQVIAESISQDFDVAMPADEPPTDTDLWWRPPSSSEPGDESSGDVAEASTTTVSEEEALDSREPDEAPEPEAAYPDEAPAALPDFRRNGAAQRQPEYTVTEAAAEPTAESVAVKQFQVMVESAAFAEFYDEEPDGSEASEPEPAPRRITITMQRSPDAEKDRRRINRVLDFVNSYPGLDQLRIRLVGPVKTHVFDFPNHSTLFDGEVEAFLRTEFGSDAIQVDPLL